MRSLPKKKETAGESKEEGRGERKEERIEGKRMREREQNKKRYGTDRKKKMSSTLAATAAARLRPGTLCLLAAGCHCPPPRLVNIIAGHSSSSTILLFPLSLYI